MPSGTRQINFSIVEQNAIPRKIELTPPPAAADDDYVSGSPWRITTEVNEDRTKSTASLTVPTKASGTLEYRYKISRSNGNSTGRFYLEAGVDPINFDVLVEVGGAATVTTMRYVDDAVAVLDATVVHKSGAETIAGVKTFSSLPVIPETEFGSGWNGSSTPATKNAIYDHFQIIPFKGVFNITQPEFGAVMDGVTNDAPAFKAAFDAAVAAGGGTVYVPPGNMRFSGDPGNFNGISTYPNIKICGSNGSNIIFTDAAHSDGLGSPYMWMSSFGILKFEDLTFIGSTDETMQSADRIMQLGYCRLVVMINCRFYGLGTTGSDALAAVVLFNNAPAVLEKCYFAGCCATASGVVVSTGGSGITMRDTHFIDYGYYQGVNYSTAPKPYCYSWFRVTGLDNITNAGYKGIVIENCILDEAPLWGIRIEGTSVANKYPLQISDSSINCGNNRGGGAAYTKALYVSNIGDVKISNLYVGFSNNTDTYLAAEFNNCDNVDLDKFVGLYGAKYVAFTGTTKRAKLRNCTLAGDGGSFSLGWDNSAGAFIDADTPMPATASASTISPKGKKTHITGTTTINTIDLTNLKENDELTLIFDSTAGLTEAGNIILNGTTFSGTANDIWRGVVDGSNVIEISRSAN